MITLTLYATQPPPAILRALRTYAGDWRESHVPELLRRGGVLSVECTFRGDECILGYTRRWHAGLDRGAPLRLRARIDADPRGGTIVGVSVGHWTRPRDAALATLILVLLVAAGIAFDRSSVVPIIGLAVFAAAVNLWLIHNANRGLKRVTSAEADYLVSRVEDAIANAGHAPPVASAS